MNCSRVGCSIAAGRVGDLDQPLLRRPNVSEPAHSGSSWANRA